jgi:diguanylate cyclase (GGDEF)-like protein
VTLPGGGPAERFSGLLEDREGRLWAAGEQGLACRTGSEWHRFTTRDGLNRNHVAFVAETRSGEIWAAYFEPVGLERFRLEGVVLRKTGALDANRGLASGKVYLVGEDARGQLWVGTGKGVDVVSERGSAHYGAGEGLVGEDCDSNAVLAEPDGSVLIGTTSGFSLFNGRDVAMRLEPPRAVLVEARLGRARVALPSAERLRVARGEATLEVRFAGLSFLNEVRVEHQVRLLGLEDVWRPTRVREARYVALPRGEYRFEVRARVAPAGEWGKVAGLDFTVFPAPWETLWFRGLVVLLLGAFVAGGVRWRLSTLRRRTNELEALVADRTRELNSANEALTNLSLTDPLTGLKNRRFLALRIGEDIAALERAHHGTRNTNEPSSVTDLVFLMVDIDHFKEVNDQFGHAAGDRVLKAIGGILMVATRLSDTVVRWGGEEFLVVARQLNRDAAPILAERIRLAVESHPFAIGEGRTIHRTCSVGFAPYPFVSGVPKLLGWEAVVGVADLCLYVAKSSGRNVWVGLNGTSRTRHEGLEERLSSGIPVMLREGELSVSTSAHDPSALRFE